MRYKHREYFKIMVVIKMNKYNVFKYYLEFIKLLENQVI
jgi:hypothetical protein